MLYLDRWGRGIRARLPDVYAVGGWDWIVLYLMPAELGAPPSALPWHASSCGDASHRTGVVRGTEGRVVAMA